MKTIRSILQCIKPRAPKNQPTSALGFWKSKYNQSWNMEMSQSLIEREGSIVGANSLYLRQPFRIEEYSILDALLRYLSERQSEVKVLDVSCGSGLACFFIAANSKRYAHKVKYLGINSS